MPQNPVINKKDKVSVTTWDCVYFGYYKQDNDFVTETDEDGIKKRCGPVRS